MQQITNVVPLVKIRGLKHIMCYEKYFSALAYMNNYTISLPNSNDRCSIPSGEK